MTIKTKITAGEDVFELDFDPAHHATAEEAAKAYAAALRKLRVPHAPRVALLPPEAPEWLWQVMCEDLDDDCVHGGWGWTPANHFRQPNWFTGWGEGGWGMTFEDRETEAGDV